MLNELIPKNVFDKNFYIPFDLDYFMKLFKHAKLSATRGNQEGFEKLSRGEYHISGFAPCDQGMRYVDDGAPIKPLDFKEGIVVRKFRLVALNHLPHPNATKVLINWLLSKEGQLVLTKAKHLVYLCFWSRKFNVLIVI